jgi:hypothetical protein
VPTMRELKASDKNEVVIFDKQSGTKILFFYNTPKTTERINYKSELTKAVVENKNDAAKAIADVQLKFALQSICGFAENNFCVDDVAISSNPEKPNYYADWKMYLAENAADLLFTFADIVFDAPNYQIKGDKVFF